MPEDVDDGRDDSSFEDGKIQLDVFFIRSNLYFLGQGEDEQSHHSILNEDTREEVSNVIDDPNQPNQDFNICMSDFLNEAIDSGKKFYDDEAIQDNQLSKIIENNLHAQLTNDELQILQRVLFDYDINSNVEKVFDYDIKEYLRVGENSVNTSQQDQLEIVPKCPNSKICKFYCSGNGLSDNKYRCNKCNFFPVPTFICVREKCCGHYSICIRCSMDDRVSKMLRGVMSTRGTAFLAGGKGEVNTLKKKLFPLNNFKKS